MPAATVVARTIQKRWPRQPNSQISKPMTQVVAVIPAEISPASSRISGESKCIRDFLPSSPVLPAGAEHKPKTAKGQGELAHLHRRSPARRAEHSLPGQFQIGEGHRLVPREDVPAAFGGIDPREFRVE